MIRCCKSSALESVDLSAFSKSVGGGIYNRTETVDDEEVIRPGSSDM
jgi:hypothetical protein